MPRPGSAALRRPVRAREAEKAHRKHLDEAGDGEPRGQREQRAADGEDHLDRGRGQAAPSAGCVCKVSHSLTKPLSGGKAEIARTPIRNSTLVHGMRAGDAAEPVEIAAAGARLDRTGAEEQQRLVDRMIGEVIERGDQRDPGDDRHGGRQEHHARRRARPR